MKSKIVQDVNEWLSLSEAERQAGVSRRSIQRWIKAGSLAKGQAGKVRFGDVLRQKGIRTKGRKPKGLPSGEHPLYRGVVGTPEWELAEPFMNARGLERLEGMLYAFSHHLQIEKAGLAFVNVLERVMLDAFKTHNLQVANGYKDSSWRGREKRAIYKGHFAANAPIDMPVTGVIEAEASPAMD